MTTRARRSLLMGLFTGEKRRESDAANWFRRGFWRVVVMVSQAAKLDMASIVRGREEPLP